MTYKKHGTAVLFGPTKKSTSGETQKFIAKSRYQIGSAGESYTGSQWYFQ